MSIENSFSHIKNSVDRYDQIMTNKKHLSKDDITTIIGEEGLAQYVHDIVKAKNPIEHSTWTSKVITILNQASVQAPKKNPLQALGEKVINFIFRNRFLTNAAYARSVKDDLLKLDLLNKLLHKGDAASIEKFINTVTSYVFKRNSGKEDRLTQKFITLLQQIYQEKDLFPLRYNAFVKGLLNREDRTEIFQALKDKCSARHVNVLVTDFELDRKLGLEQQKQIKITWG